jgi:preprotein translocase subunit SecG
MTVILVAHILVALVLVVVVLMQRSEGGALGIGGGGGGAGGGLMSGRGVAGALVRTTIIFGAIFFVTSLGLTTIATKSDGGGLTEIEQNLERDFGTDPIEDSLGVDTFDDVLQGNTDIDLSTDPLAVSPEPSSEAPETEETGSDDPLADPLADPQE